jgi:hypothetical protein
LSTYPIEVFLYLKAKRIGVEMKLRASVFITLISLVLLNGQVAFATTFSSSAKVAAKPIPLSIMREVLIYDSSYELTKVLQVKLNKNNSYSATVKVDQVFQLLVAGLWPDLVATPIIINTKGLSEYLMWGVPNLDGILAMPYLAIKKKGNYTILIRQPDEKMLSYLRLRVS